MKGFHKPTIGVVVVLIIVGVLVMHFVGKRAAKSGS